MANKNTYTLNKIVGDFSKNSVNVLQILESIASIVNDTKEFVTIKFTDNDGNIVEKKLPSIGKMQADLSVIKNLLNDLYDFKNKDIFVVQDGISYPIIVQNYPYELEPPTNITNITYTRKNNQYHTRIYASNIEKHISYKKYVLDLEDIDFNNINVTTENELLTYLNDNSISYNVHYEMQHNMPGKIAYYGEFAVLQNVKNEYVLDKITYTNDKNETFRLQLNDILFINNTELKIIDLNANTNTIKLQTIKGYNSIGIGDVLKLLSEFSYNEFIDIPCELEENYFIFIKNINESYNVESIEQTNAIKVNVSTLTLDGKVITEFDQENRDESYEIPIYLGYEPNAPILNVNDFNVVRINDHLFQDSLVVSIKEKISRKNELISEIKEIDSALESKKSLLSITNTNTLDKTKTTENDIQTLTNKRKNKSNEYTSIVGELNSINTNEIKNIKPKFRLRGFFDIPKEITSQLTGTQHIVQFLISYRYIGKNSEVSQSKNFTRTDEDGNKRFGTFSDWNEIKSIQRNKIYDENSGKYIWEDQKNEDGQQVNINQVDIPIQRGEIVELRVRSISEVGFPDKPLMSEWSNIISIGFPDEITDVNDLSELLKNSSSDDANMLIENILSTKGIDNHIKNSVTKEEQYYAHPASELMSGIYDDNGKILSVEQILKQYQTEINELKKIALNEIPELNVSLITPTGEEIPLLKNATNKVFAGYFVDDLNKIPVIEQPTAIIVKNYQLLLYNNSGASIHLNSISDGGLDESISTNYAISDKRNYENVPIYVHEDNNDEKFSLQSKGQFIYSRFKNYSFGKNLYINDTDACTWYSSKILDSGKFAYQQSDLATLDKPNFNNGYGAYVYMDIESKKDIYVGAPDYGSIKELKTGKDNGILIPITFMYKLTDEGSIANMEFKKIIGFDIFMFQMNTVSFDIEFSVKYNKDTFFSIK